LVVIVVVVVVVEDTSLAQQAAAHFGIGWNVRGVHLSCGRRRYGGEEEGDELHIDYYCFC